MATTLALLALLVGAAAAAPAPGSPFAAPWVRFQERAVAPSPRTQPGIAAGLPPVCACAVFALPSAPCQDAARAHCGAAHGAAAAGFCRAVVGGGLKHLAADPAGLAAVGGYLQEECFPADSVRAEEPDFCPCFKVRAGAEAGAAQGTWARRLRRHSRA
jgi:hypothetical protein